VRRVGSIVSVISLPSLHGCAFIALEYTYGRGGIAVNPERPGNA
jgi:hypothetical protein